MEKTNKEKIRLDVDNMPEWLSELCSPKYKKSIIAGINDDDCAIIQSGKEQIVLTTDFLNSNPIALELGIANLWDIGRILVASNLSDLYGSCAYPLGFLTSIMLSKEDATEEDFKLLMTGVKFELDRHHIPLIGGDTKLGSVNNYCGIALGKRKAGTKLILKNGAKVNDSIWVSGKLGSVAAATTGLKDHEMTAKWVKWAKKKIINPKLPVKKSLLLAKSKLGNGGTDISDGLGADLWSICRASGTGAIIYVDKIPISKILSN
jgi:thiamine-monophosphate kinase